MRPENTLLTRETKELRASLQEIISLVNLKGSTRPASIAVTKLEEAKMWLGKHLAEIPGNEDLNAKRDAEELKMDI